MEEGIYDERKYRKFECEVWFKTVLLPLDGLYPSTGYYLISLGLSFLNYEYAIDTNNMYLLGLFWGFNKIIRYNPDVQYPLICSG